MNTLATVPHPKRAWFRRTIWPGALALLLALLLGLPTLAAPAQPQAGNYNVYLPLITKQQTSTAPSPTPTPEPGQNNQGGVFVTRDVQTNSASAAVDAQGGMHTAYAGYSSANRSAFYAFCAGTCTDPAQWKSVALANNVDAVQLALTPQGQPRMLLTIDRALEESQFGALFKYAACDTNCASAASWSIVTVAQTDDTDPYRFEQPRHYFALDPQGRPRFVYRSQYVFRNLGTFYVACDSNCTDPSAVEQNWVQTNISQSNEYEVDLFSMPALAFTKAGQPRILADVIAVAGENGIYYLACDANCAESASWQHVKLFERGQGPDAAWDLALDSSDHPRIAMYQEALPDGGDWLLYAWCNTDCLGNGWAGTTIGLEQGDGLTPDLALDAQGHPRIAYHPLGVAGLSYLWCNSACESNNGQWITKVIDPNETVDAAFPLPVPPACDQAGWSTGFRPSLVLDAQGSPRIAADALREMRCAYTDPSDPAHPKTRIETYHYSRFVFLPQP